jgi:hypothetical protein
VSSGRTRLALVVTLAVGAALAPSRAAAEPSEARLAITPLGLRFNLGEFRDAFPWGWQQFGAEAALQPWRAGTDLVRFGPAWWLYIGEQYRSVTGVDDDLSILEAGLGLRLAATVPWQPWGLTFNTHVLAGYELFRTNLPVLSSDQKQFFGPALGAGLELDFGASFVGVHALWDVVLGGPMGVNVCLVFGLERGG